MGRTDNLLQLNQLSLRNKQLKLKTSRKLPIILEEVRGSLPHTSKEKLKDVNM